MTAEEEESGIERSPSPSVSAAGSYTSNTAIGSETVTADDDVYVGDAVDSAHQDMLQLNLEGEDMFDKLPSFSPAADKAKDEEEADKPFEEELAYTGAGADEEGVKVDYEADKTADEEGVEVDYEADKRLPMRKESKSTMKPTRLR